MKLCKVRPSVYRCKLCIDMQEEFGAFEDCSKREVNTGEYELLQIGTGFWSGDYAMVQKNGKIEKVSLNRVYDVRETG